MAARIKTSDDLLRVLAAKSAAPPPEGVALLVRHLKCNESVELTRILVAALPRYAEHHAKALQPPTELLPPLA